MWCVPQCVPVAGVPEPGHHHAVPQLHRVQRGGAAPHQLALAPLPRHGGAQVREEEGDVGPRVAAAAVHLAHQPPAPGLLGPHHAAGQPRPVVPDEVELERAEAAPAQEVSRRLQPGAGT